MVAVEEAEGLEGEEEGAGRTRARQSRWAGAASSNISGVCGVKVGRILWALGVCFLGQHTVAQSHT